MTAIMITQIKGAIDNDRKHDKKGINHVALRQMQRNRPNYRGRQKDRTSFWK